MSRRPFAVVGCVVAFATALSTQSTAQIPDKFTNLKVLPKDIQKQDLVKIMRGFSNALNVRCIHCHKGDDPVDLSKVDFASDERENKLVARAMLGMTNGINCAPSWRRCGRNRSMSPASPATTATAVLKRSSTR
jgi:hypothetical protein